MYRDFGVNPVNLTKPRAALHRNIAPQAGQRRLQAVPPIYLIRGASRTPTGPPALVMAPSSL